MIPIRDDGVLQKAILDKIFLNIEELVTLHNSLLLDLEECINSWSNESNFGIALSSSVFSSPCPFQRQKFIFFNFFLGPRECSETKKIPNFIAYKFYCSNYHEALQVLEEKSKNTPKLKSFISVIPFSFSLWAFF